MPRGPKKVDREARPGCLTPGEAVARNVRAYRGIRNMTQADLAKLMSELGHEWTAGTVGFVERHQRTVSIDEYAGLTLCLGRKVGELFDPTGPLGDDTYNLDVGGVGAGWIEAPYARKWTRSEGPALRWQGMGSTFFLGLDPLDEPPAPDESEEPH